MQINYQHGLCPVWFWHRSSVLNGRVGFVIVLPVNEVKLSVHTIAPVNVTVPPFDGSMIAGAAPYCMSHYGLIWTIFYGKFEELLRRGAAVLVHCGLVQRLMQEPCALGSVHGLATTADAKFLIDGAEVVFDGKGRNSQEMGNLFVREAFRQQDEDFAFTIR